MDIMNNAKKSIYIVGSFIGIIIISGLIRPAFKNQIAANAFGTAMLFVWIYIVGVILKQVKSDE